MSLRELGRRAAWAILVHALLLALWPLVAGLYGPFFRAFGETGAVVVHPWPDWLEVHLDPGITPELARDQIAPDTTLRLAHRERSGSGVQGASSFFHGWLPMSVLLALFAAATPLPWRARGRPLAWALLGLHLVLLLRLSVAVTYGYSLMQLEGQPLLVLSPGAARALRLAWHLAWGEPSLGYLVPLALWALCVFDRRSSVR